MLKLLSLLSQHLSSLEKIAVGVSGGCDSMALLYLLRQVHPKTHILAITINHELRNDSLVEAYQVKSLVEQLGVEHLLRTIEWRQSGPPKTAIEETARIKRYQIFQEECHLRGIQDLFLAHHLDDALETMVLRIAGKSGIYGIAGLNHRRRIFGLNLHRPLLSVRKEELRNVCISQGVQWIEDPTNYSFKHKRNHIRAQLKQLELENPLKHAKLTDLYYYFLGERISIDTKVGEIIKNPLLIQRFSKWSIVKINPVIFKQFSPLVISRVFLTMHDWIFTGGFNPPRHSWDQLKTAYQQFIKHKAVSYGKTLLIWETDWIIMIKKPLLKREAVLLTRKAGIGYTRFDGRITLNVDLENPQSCWIMLRSYEEWKEFIRTLNCHFEWPFPRGETNKLWAATVPVITKGRNPETSRIISIPLITDITAITDVNNNNNNNDNDDDQIIFTFKYSRVS